MKIVVTFLAVIKKAVNINIALTTAKILKVNKIIDKKVVLIDNKIAATRADSQNIKVKIVFKDMANILNVNKHIGKNGLGIGYFQTNVVYDNAIVTDD